LIKLVHLLEQSILCVFLNPRINVFDKDDLGDLSGVVAFFGDRNLGYRGSFLSLRHLLSFKIMKDNSIREIRDGLIIIILIKS